MSYLLRITLISLCFSVLLSSCYLHIPKEQRNCYKVLDEFAKENWKIDSNNLVRNVTRETVAFLHRETLESECAKKLNQKNLKKIFGEPYEIDERTRTWYYYTVLPAPLNGRSQTIPARGVQFFYFGFDNKGNLIRTGSGGS